MHKTFWLLGLVGMFLVGCKIPQEPRFERIAEFSPHLGGGERPSITLGLEMYNPNAYKIKLLAYDLDIYLNGKKVGDAVKKEKQQLAGHGNSTLRFELATDMNQLMGGLLGALGGLLGKENAVVVQAKGTVLARAKGIQKRVPIDFEKKYVLGKNG